MVNASPSAGSVAVVIPCYNGASYVCAAVESALTQAYRGTVRVLVVDDGSSDGSPDILRRQFSNHPRFQLLTHPSRDNRGVSASRRLGVESTDAQFVAFLDADDVFEQGKVALQVDRLSAHPDAVLCHSAARVIYENPADEKTFHESFTLTERELEYEFFKLDGFLERNPICNSTVLARRSVLVETLCHFPQLFQFEDWLNWVLLGFRGKFLFLPQRLTQYRYHAVSATAQMVRDPLRKSYSHVEFFLALLAQDATYRQGAWLSEKLGARLRQTLASIVAMYGKEQSGLRFAAGLDTLLRGADQVDAAEARALREELRIARNRLAYYDNHPLVRLRRLIKKRLG